MRNSCDRNCSEQKIGTVGCIQNAGGGAWHTSFHVMLGCRKFSFRFLGYAPCFCSTQDSWDAALVTDFPFEAYREVAIIIIVMYRHESWIVTKKLKSKITAADMKVLRLVKGVTRRDRVGNADIYEEFKIKPIIETIQTDQLR